MTHRMFCGLLLFFTLMIGGCADSEIGNPQKILALNGRMVDESGAPVANAKVFAIPADFRPGIDYMWDLATTRTYEDGSYVFDYIQFGTYNIQARDSAGHILAFRDGVSYFDSAFDVGTDTLREPGSIEGSITVNFQPGRNTTCYIPGTILYVSADDSGRFSFQQVPAGDFTLLYQYQPDTLLPASAVYSVADSNVIVSSAKKTALPAKVVINFLPRAFAGNDTVVDSGAVVTFHGTGQDSMGSIVRYEWDLDGSRNGLNFVQTPGGDTSCLVNGDVKPYFRVMDNDSNLDVDSITVSVPPRAVTITSIRMFKDTTALGEIDYCAEVKWSVNQDQDFRYYQVVYKKLTDPSWNTVAHYYDRNKTTYKFIGLQASSEYLFQINVFDSTGLFMGSAVVQDSTLAYLEPNGALFLASATAVQSQESRTVNWFAYRARDTEYLWTIPKGTELSYLPISTTRRWELRFG